MLGWRVLKPTYVYEFIDMLGWRVLKPTYVDEFIDMLGWRVLKPTYVDEFIDMLGWRVLKPTYVYEFIDMLGWRVLKPTYVDEFIDILGWRVLKPTYVDEFIDMLGWRVLKPTYVDEFIDMLGWRVLKPTYMLSLFSTRYHSQFSAAVMKCIEDAWMNKELVDVTVEVENTKFECHSFLLSVCSGFFKSILKDNVESEQKYVKINDITAKTFRHVLKALYSGIDIINNKNITYIWYASHKLQIPFLTARCENLALLFTTLMNCKEIYDCAKKLKSQAVLSHILEFIAKNFNDCKDSELLVDLSGDDLLSIIKHEDLVVKNEDIVIDVIFEWMDHSSAKLESCHTKSFTECIADDKLNCSKLQTLDFSNHIDSPYKFSNFLNSENSQDEEINTETTDTTPVEEALVVKKCEKNKDVFSICQTTDTYKERLDNMILHKTVPYRMDVTELGKTTSQTPEDFFPEDKSSRLIYFIPLLQACKTCLLSPHCLARTYNNRLLVNNKEARDIIFNAILYQLGIKDYNGYMPSSAIHRESSSFKNVGLFVEKNGDVNMLSFSSKVWSKVSIFFHFPSRVIQVTVHKNELYALTSVSYLETHQLFVLKGLKWVKVYDIPNKFLYKQSIQKETHASKALNILGKYGGVKQKVLSSKKSENHEKENPIVLNESVASVSRFSISTLVAPASTTNPVSNIPFVVSVTSDKNHSSDVPIDTNASNTLLFKTEPPKSEDSERPLAGSFLSKGNNPDSTNLNDIHLLSHGNYIYFCGGSLIQRFDPRYPDTSTDQVTTLPDDQQIEHMSSYDELLLIFCSTADISNITTLHLFDTQSDVLTESIHLDGPAKGMTTFQDDKHKYVLQSNGTLWTMKRLSNNHILLNKLTNLWNFEYRLNGGICYEGELFLHGDDPAVFENSAPNYPEIFKQIHIQGRPETCSNFLPFIILKETFNKFLI
ncbi:hypothetical protein Btru_023052 [Bulinus truncatus]|nr:hypothetical protein Btru_023052 [Bulinus truncatus]